MKDLVRIKRLIGMFPEIQYARRRILILSGLLSLTGSLLHAQNATATENPQTNSWQNYDWLKPVEDQQRQAASGSTISATSGQTVTDPFAVLSTGALWQDTRGTLYTHRVADILSLSCETSTVTLSDGPNPYLPISSGLDDLSHGQKAGFQFQPVEALKFSGNVHDSQSDGLLPADSVVTSGAGFTAEGHLPFQSVLTLGVNSDRSGNDFVFDNNTQSTAYAGTPGTRMPSMEQSLVWKLLQDTTVQMGLRQQHYENFPGVTNEFNEALFADWSQKILPDFTWHSYAEMLNSRGIPDIAPAVPLASGANGTPQATTPGPNVSSALPLTLDDKTLTFSTGPSFRLQKDLSANIEYSNRWDQNPLPGSVGQEQRVSVSLKGTF